MATQYLIKLVQAGLKYTYVDADNDIFAFKAIVLGGQQFDETNIVTVSGGNSLTGSLAAVSGASSLRDDSQDLTIASNYSTLNNKVDTVSGGLQDQIDDILSDTAREERVEAVSGQTLITLSSITFNPLNSVRDVQVFRNMGRVFQSSTGNVSGGDFQKVGNNQIQFFYPLVAGDRITTRDERTGGGGGGGGSTDLENIAVEMAPDTNGGHAVGQNTKGFSALYLKDTTNASVWRVEIVSGALQATQV